MRIKGTMWARKSGYQYLAPQAWMGVNGQCAMWILSAVRLVVDQKLLLIA